MGNPGREMIQLSDLVPVRDPFGLLD